ncbi:SDR family oxidoreductase [Archangium sp.]|uniref:SDR family oxidoreductase n=1 Tax=Archangium sp. TaxID=1872627 RepID=UPI00389B2233
MPLSLKPLSEQVIVITGASSGIGLVTARMAARRGAKVVAVARNEDALRQLVAELRRAGGQAIAVRADVGRERDMQRVAGAAIEAFGGFDTWVNNAGVSIFGRCEDVTIPDMRRMFDTNFWGTVYGSRLAVAHFKQRGRPGALINVGSIFGDRANPVQSTYSASKHAQHGWTESLRMELEKEKAAVSVTLIHPGRIDTPYNEHARSYIPQQPAHRGMIYPPEAVAEAILFAAEHPKRDMFVGSQAKFGAVMGALAPRLMDKLMELMMFHSQRSKSRPSRSREDNALYRAGYGLHERGTHEGWIRSRSYYVKASKYPTLTIAALLGLGGALRALGAKAPTKATTRRHEPQARSAPVSTRPPRVPSSQAMEGSTHAPV